MAQEPAGAPALAAFTAAPRQQALARLAVLRSPLNEGIPCSEVARTAGGPLRAGPRWLARYRAAGLVGLARAPRSETGQRTFPVELVQVSAGMALRTPRPSIAAMHRRMTALATQHPWTPPAYGSVYGIGRQWRPAMVTLAQDGPAACRDRSERISRPRAAGPKALWPAEHTRRDGLVLDANGAAVRPWLTLSMDDDSRAVAGYTLCLEAPTTLQPALALTPGEVAHAAGRRARLRDPCRALRGAWSGLHQPPSRAGRGGPACSTGLCVGRTASGPGASGAALWDVAYGMSRRTPGLSPPGTPHPPTAALSGGAGCHHGGLLPGGL